MSGFATRPSQSASYLWAVAAIAIGFSGQAVAQQRPATEAPADVDLRWRMEGLIQKCISDKTATPEICRISAYAAALAAGMPPTEAARITGYNRPRDKQP